MRTNRIDPIPMRYHQQRHGMGQIRLSRPIWPVRCSNYILEIATDEEG